MNTTIPIRNSRRFWTLVFSSAVTLLTYFGGKYAGARAEDINQILLVTTPIAMLLIVAYTIDDMHQNYQAATTQRAQIAQNGHAEALAPSALTAAARAPAPPQFHVAAVVVKLWDGDTFHVRIRQRTWFNEVEEIEVAARLYGINAPELSTPEGKASRDYLATRVKVGDVVTLDLFSLDKYSGRVDANVYLADGALLNKEMLDKGFAVPFMV